MRFCNLISKDLIPPFERNAAHGVGGSSVVHWAHTMLFSQIHCLLVWPVLFIPRHHSISCPYSDINLFFCCSTQPAANTPRKNSVDFAKLLQNMYLQRAKKGHLPLSQPCLSETQLMMILMHLLHLQGSLPLGLFVHFSHPTCEASIFVSY